MTSKPTGILFDINQFVPFDLDDDMKKKICFSETLLISTLHDKIIQPPEKKHISIIQVHESEESEAEEGEESEGSEEAKGPETPTPSNFDFYFYNKKIPDGEPTEDDSLMVVDGVPQLNPKRKKIRCTCLAKGNWASVCVCPEKSMEDLPETYELSTTSESSLSTYSDLSIVPRSKHKICKCSFTEPREDVCKCGEKKDKLKRKRLTKISEVVVSESSTSERTPLESSVHDDLSLTSESSLSVNNDLSLTSESSLSVDDDLSLTTESSMSVDDLSLTSESSLSVVTLSEETAKQRENEENIQRSELSLTSESSLSPESSLKKKSSASTTSKGSSESVIEGCPAMFLSPDICTTTGGIALSVETVGVNNDKFSINLSSQYVKDGFDTGNDLLSVVDMNLHTLEESRSEHQKSMLELIENQYCITLSGTGYNCTTTCIEKENKVSECKNIKFEDAYDFILEGANIILLRYLALKRFKGKFTSKFTDIHGNICESTYVTRIVKNAVVNNKKMPVLKVGRVNTDSHGYITSECYVLTLLGYLVQHQWSESNLVVHINPLLPIDADTNQICRQIPLRDNWREDMEMLSKFLDFKDRRLMENESYLAGKVQLQSILTDYFQTILLLKPRDVLPFTKGFFLSFAKTIHLPHNSYFDKHCQRVRYSHF